MEEKRNEGQFSIDRRRLDKQKLLRSKHWHMASDQAYGNLPCLSLFLIHHTTKAQQQIDREKTHHLEKLSMDLIQNDHSVCAVLEDNGGHVNTKEKGAVQRMI